MPNKMTHLTLAIDITYRDQSKVLDVLEKDFPVEQLESQMAAVMNVIKTAGLLENGDGQIAILLKPAGTVQ